MSKGADSEADRMAASYSAVGIVFHGLDIFGGPLECGGIESVFMSMLLCYDQLLSVLRQPELAATRHVGT